MERLTKRITENQIELSAKANTPQHYSPIIHIKHPFWTVFDKLAEYEQAEEDGLLIRIECRCKDCVHVDYAGCSNTTCYCMKNSCFMQEDDFCKYAEKSKLMNTTETIGYADNGGLMSVT